MDTITFKERLKRLKEVNKAISELDPAIRAAAFSLLEEYVMGAETGGPTKKLRREHREEDVHHVDDDYSLFEKFDHDKPADAAKLIAAWHYSQYGSEPFSMDDVKAVADRVGATIPGRPDMTFGQTKEKGKKLFARSGRGKFKPTVHGESYMKSNYKVKKGRKIKPAESDE